MYPPEFPAVGIEQLASVLPASATSPSRGFHWRFAQVALTSMQECEHKTPTDCRKQNTNCSKLSTAFGGDTSAADALAASGCWGACQGRDDTVRPQASHRARRPLNTEHHPDEGWKGGRGKGGVKERKKKHQDKKIALKRDGKVCFPCSLTCFKGTAGSRSTSTTLCQEQPPPSTPIPFRSNIPLLSSAAVASRACASQPEDCCCSGGAGHCPRPASSGRCSPRPAAEEALATRGACREWLCAKEGRGGVGWGGGRGKGRKGRGGG
jgi:hypothetical protein